MKLRKWLAIAAVAAAAGVGVSMAADNEIDKIKYTQTAGSEMGGAEYAKTAGNGIVGMEYVQENDASNWQLILVNRWNPIPEGYEVELTQLDHGQAVDNRIYPYLQEMFDAARSEGIYPTISSSYRSYETQQAEMEEKIGEYLAQGYSREEAADMAEEWVALPGTSEHELGMAVDITTADWTVQDAQTVWQWFLDNSYRFGFINRYPEEKADITGIAHEAWHYRYVGYEAAKEIYEKGICLEEYLAGQ
ncbi:MAG: M15 family metallopeptidase [Eubacteriales bacterium]|nr:M15 family metallopeptidase [Eubacteriales bacterium]